MVLTAFFIRVSLLSSKIHNGDDTAKDSRCSCKFYYTLSHSQAVQHRIERRCTVVCVMLLKIEILILNTCIPQVVVHFPVTESSTAVGWFNVGRNLQLQLGF